MSCAAVIEKVVCDPVTLADGREELSGARDNLAGEPGAGATGENVVAASLKLRIRQDLWLLR
jgi:hypothetical protein